MNIVEAFKIIKADETKCARRVGREEYLYFFEKRVLYIERLKLQKPVGERDYIFSLLAILSDWEVLPIAPLNRIDNGKKFSIS